MALHVMELLDFATVLVLYGDPGAISCHLSALQTRLSAQVGHRQSVKPRPVRRIVLGTVFSSAGSGDL